MKRLFFLLAVLFLSVMGANAQSTCSRCDGDGKIYDKCAYCDDGWRVCNGCNGKRVRRCTVCFGEGKYQCYGCNGRGYYVDKHGDRNDCPRCGGVGTPTCTMCHGDGEVVCTSCDGAGGHKCRECGGSGVREWTCPECRGTGSKD